MLDLKKAIAQFGAQARAKLANPAATGEPEDQLRAPLERLFADLAELCGFKREWLAAVGESSLSKLKTRPDYAITLRNVLVGFVEVKAPGKGADPRRYKGHDKEQWEKLQSLPNLLYTDGNSFSLWQNGELVGSIVALQGDIEASGDKLAAPLELVARFDNFLRWEPIPPKSAAELANVSARLCRLLRDEVTEQLAEKSPALTALAADWRKLLFPEANDRAIRRRLCAGRYVRPADGPVEQHPPRRRARPGRQATRQDQLADRRGTAAAHRRSRQRGDAEDVARRAGPRARRRELARDQQGKARRLALLLRGLPGRLRQHAAETHRLVLHAAGSRRADDPPRRRRAAPTFRTAAPAWRRADVTLADPAVGTGTFILGVLRRIAADVEADQGAGAVPQAIESAIGRLIAFEMQLGPFAVAQLRMYAELIELIGKPPRAAPADVRDRHAGQPLRRGRGARLLVRHDLRIPAAGQRDQADGTDHRRDRQSAVQGKSQGPGRLDRRRDTPEATVAAQAWIPPADWGVGAHAKHLRNLYVYFWRWATWKVFDHDPKNDTGIVCFITVAGFLNGPGFQKMRDYLRRTADRIWVIDCSPEGHQPDVPTRIFQAVQQPVCIVLAARSKQKAADKPAAVKYTVLAGRQARREIRGPGASSSSNRRSGKIARPTGERRSCPRPPATGRAYPALDDLFAYNGSGVMPGRTWVIAPDAESLRLRWRQLISAQAGAKGRVVSSRIFAVASRADRHVDKVCKRACRAIPTILNRSLTTKAIACRRCATAIAHSTVNGSFPTAA